MEEGRMEREWRKGGGMRRRGKGRATSLFLVCDQGGWFIFIHREDGAKVYPSWQQCEHHVCPV